MKNSIFYLLSIIAFISLSCCTKETQKPEIIAEDLPAGAELTTYEDAPELTRAVVKNGETITLEGDVLNGKKQGAWIEYDNKGAVESITNYYQGLQHGVSLTFDNQGYISTQSNYSQGILHGAYRTYNRRKISEEKTYVKGDLDGVVKKYYSSGKLMQEAPYVEGKMHGIAKWYDEEGNLSLAYKYDNGELVDKEPKLD